MNLEYFSVNTGALVFFSGEVVDAKVADDIVIDILVIVINGLLIIISIIVFQFYENK
jgi:hypothetical protein|tara:strand:+ start:28125 stop:28295 length:171 start_codon:yes stop_codon:yes gene_type:complete